MEFKEFEPRFKSAKINQKTSLNLAPGYKSWNIWYNFKWNQPYLSRGLNLNRRSNSLNSASVRVFIDVFAFGELKDH